MISALIIFFGAHERRVQAQTRASRLLLKDPQGWGAGGCLGPWPVPADLPPHPHEKNFLQAKNETYQRVQI